MTRPVEQEQAVCKETRRSRQITSNMCQLSCLSLDRAQKFLRPERRRRLRACQQDSWRVQPAPWGLPTRKEVGREHRRIL